MLINSDIKFIKSLYLKKNRDNNSLFVVEGEKLVKELLNSNFRIKKIYGTNTWYENNYSIVDRNLFCKVTSKELKRISNLKTPNNVLAIVHKQDQLLDYTNLKGLTLVLDNINDPGNLGTIIRSCHWFNIKNIVCSNNTVDMYNLKVIQSTMGSIFKVNIVYTDILSFLKQCKGNHTIYGACLEGDDVKKTKITCNAILLVGNESHGISDLLVKYIDQKITIKGISDNIDSLNVASATSILLHEFS